MHSIYNMSMFNLPLSKLYILIRYWLRPEICMPSRGAMYCICHHLWLFKREKELIVARDSTSDLSERIINIQLRLSFQKLYISSRAKPESQLKKLSIFYFIVWNSSHPLHFPNLYFQTWIDAKERKCWIEYGKFLRTRV